MWIIGYNLELIFGGQFKFAALCLLIYALTLAEKVIMNYKIDGDADKISKLSSFNFEDIEVKLNFAKAKFFFSVVLGILIGVI